MTVAELKRVHTEIRAALERALVDIISVEYAGGMEQAISVVDEAMLKIENDIAPKPHIEHDFVGDACDCELCGEGWCHYLHAQDPSRQREDER